MSELDGTWVLVRFDWFGAVQVALAGSAVLRVEADQFSVKAGDYTYASGTVRLDASVRPRRADFIQYLGTDFSAVQAGIYEVEGDELRLRLSESEVAPEEFEGDKGLAVYRREKLT
jgi:uncharacterized protein (TIGR03067 family)